MSQIKWEKCPNCGQTNPHHLMMHECDICVNLLSKANRMSQITRLLIDRTVQILLGMAPRPLGEFVAVRSELLNASNMPGSAPWLAPWLMLTGDEFLEVSGATDRAQ